MAFHGKVALVTGAASGMGRVAALRLANAGAKVAAVDLDPRALERLARGAGENQNPRLRGANIPAGEGPAPFYTLKHPARRLR